MATRTKIAAADRTLVAALASALTDIPQVSFAYLFGSRARGQARADSDIDVALMLTADAARLDTFDRLKFLCPRLIPIAGEGLDMVFLDEASPLLAHRVLRDGILIHEKDPVARVRFYVKAVGLYFDTQVLRDVQLEATLARAREGRRIGRSPSPREAS